MPTILNPYITYNGDARQALEFYQQVFGGELDLNTYGDFGAGEGDAADRIMHGMLRTGGGLVLMAADNPPGTDHTPGGDISVSLSGEDDAELRGYWQKLSDGGTVTVPMEKQMWGDVFGMCTDRFGITWLVNINQPRS